MLYLLLLLFLSSVCFGAGDVVVVLAGNFADLIFKGWASYGMGGDLCMGSDLWIGGDLCMGSDTWMGCDLCIGK